MSEVLVGISEYRTSDDPGVVLVTRALGSCMAVVVHDPVRVAGGVIHFALPESSASPNQAREQPAMFADTGVPLLLQAMLDLGCRKESLRVILAGGGDLYDPRGIFGIGRYNHLIARKVLGREGLPIAGEEIGGARSRAARLFVATGRVVVSSRAQEVEI